MSRCISCDKILSDEELVVTNGEFCKKHFREIQEDREELEAFLLARKNNKEVKNGNRT